MRKKILIVVRGEAIGGGTEYLITLIKMLHEKFDVEIHMTYSEQQVLDNYLKYLDRVHFHYLPIDRAINPIKDFKSIAALIKLIHEEKFDIVQTNTSKGGIVGRIAAKVTGVDFIVHTVHGFAFHEESTKSSIKIYSLIEKAAAHCCDYMITVNDFHKDWAIELNIAPESKLLSIPNGLDVKRVEPTLDRETVRKEVGIDEEEIALFTIGRLAQEKGIDYLIDAMTMLKKDEVKSNYHLYIVGVGEIEESLKKKVKELDIESRITFMGYRNDISNLLVAADIVILPSFREGLSIALLEAMAAEKPIITTDIGSNLTVVNDREEALVVESKNAYELKEAIKELLEDDKLRTTLSANGKKMFEANFTKELMEDRYTKFFKEVAQLTVN